MIEICDQEAFDEVYDVIRKKYESIVSTIDCSYTTTVMDEKTKAACTSDRIMAINMYQLREMWNRFFIQQKTYGEWTYTFIYNPNECHGYDNISKHFMTIKFVKNPLGGVTYNRIQVDYQIDNTFPYNDKFETLWKREFYVPLI